MPNIPNDREDALRAINNCDLSSVGTLNRGAFVQVWAALAFAYPQLHPDDYEDWPPELQPFAREAWRRFDNEDLNDSEMYPINASRSGVLFSMKSASLCDYAPGDRFFGVTSSLLPNENTMKSIERLLVVNDSGIVEHILEPPIVKSLTRKLMRPTWRYCW